MLKRTFTSRHDPMNGSLQAHLALESIGVEFPDPGAIAGISIGTTVEAQQERLPVTRPAYIDSEVAGCFTLAADCIDAKQVDPRVEKRDIPAE